MNLNIIFYSLVVRWGLLNFHLNTGFPPSSPSSPPPPRLPRPPPPPHCPFIMHCSMWCAGPQLWYLVSSVWRAGPQPRSCEFNKACRTSTQSYEFSAGPQPWSCEFNKAYRTSTAIPWVQCGVPDLNRDPVSSVWRSGPQPRSCEFNVACRTSNNVSKKC